MESVHHLWFHIECLCLCLARGISPRLVRIRNDSLVGIVGKQLSPIGERFLLVETEHVANCLLISSGTAGSDSLFLASHGIL